MNKIEFVQDYVQVEGITFLAHALSVAKTRLVGRVALDIYDRDCHPVVLRDIVVRQQASRVSPPRLSFAALDSEAASGCGK